MPYPIKGEQRNTGRTHFVKEHIPWNKGTKGKYSKEYVEKLKVSHKDKKPSLITREKMSKAHRGEKSHFWKGGITEGNQIIRNSFKYAIWRNEIYKRDRWTCRMCGKKCGKDIIAHHLKLFSEFPELRFDVDNGITLCRSCHKKIHDAD